MKDRWIALLVLALASAGSVGQAQDPADPSAQHDEAARERFQAGLAFYEDGRYEEALPEFEAAWDLSHRPEMLVNVANAAERALSYERAVSALEEYLELNPDAENADALRRRIERNRGAAERLAGGESTDQEIDLQPTPDGSGGSGGSTVRLAGWLTIGGAGALGVASLITGLVSHGTYTDLEDACSPVCPPDRASDIDRGRALATASTVLSGIALAAGIAGVVLVIVGRDGGGDNEDEDESETAVVEVLPGLTGASVRVRY